MHPSRVAGCELEGGAITFRTKLQLSFKCEHEHEH
jgi:hypothetical protein